MSLAPAFRRHNSDKEHRPACGRKGPCSGIKYICGVAYHCVAFSGGVVYIYRLEYYKRSLLLPLPLRSSVSPRPMWQDQLFVDQHWSFGVVIQWLLRIPHQDFSLNTKSRLRTQRAQVCVLSTMQTGKIGALRGTAEQVAGRPGAGRARAEQDG